MNWKKLKLLRTAQRVTRMHTMPTRYQQSVGEHTFGVLSIVLTIHPNATPQLLRATLYHDIPEAVTGDVPATAKWRWPDMETALRGAEEWMRREFELSEELPSLERKVLKFADMMELLLFSLEEADAGDRKMVVIARNCITALRTRGLIDVTPAAYELFSFAQLYLEKHHSAIDGEEIFNVTQL